MTNPAPGPLTIGFLIDRWDPTRGGAEAVMARAAAHLERRGHDVLAIACEARPDAPGRHVRVTAPRFQLGRGRFERALGDALVGAARAARCDLTIGVRHLSEVDVFWPHGGAHLVSLRARAESRGRARPAEPYGRHKTFVELEDALLAGGARRVWCVSERVRANFLERHPESGARLDVVPTGVDLTRFHPDHRAAARAALDARWPAAAGAPLIAFLAREPWLKGLALLFEALERLPAELPWRLAVAGPARPSRWLARARKRGLAERVLVERDAVPAELLAAADLLCTPTYHDTAGLVLLEAMAAGTPVVTTARAGEAPAVTAAAGVVLPAPDAALLADALAAELERRARDPRAPDDVRAAVRERGEEAWLADVEARLVALASERTP